MDIANDILPITPAAHYTCGGIKTDLNGCTSVPGLFAAGEAACTGLHGGNRLASTSLLEGVVFGASVGDYCGADSSTSRSEYVRQILQDRVPARNHGNASGNNPDMDTEIEMEAVEVLSSVRKTMWENVGLVRTREGMEDAIESLEGFRDRAEALFESAPTQATAGLRDAAHSGLAVATAAASNSVSVGTHFRMDDSQEQQDDDGADAQEPIPALN